MSIELNSDKSINKIPRTDLFALEAPAEKVAVTGTENLQGKAINKDGTDLHNTRGKVPAAGFSFNAAETPEVIKTAEKFMTYFLNDSNKLSSFSTALEKLASATSLADLSEDDMLALMQLGFDVTVNNGKLIVRDSNGNEVKPNELQKGIENLKSTVTRAMANLAKGNVSQAAIQANSAPFVPDPEAVKELNSLINETNETSKAAEISKAELERNKAEYQEMAAKIESNNAEIDTTVSQILTLKEKAQKIISGAKELKTITEAEKNELKSIESTIKIKQAKLNNIQNSSELLMKQATEVYNTMSPELNETEKNTMSALHTALEAKVAGKAMTARQNFLATISADIYNLTAGMSDGELQIVLSDPDMRVKMFSPVNKMLDRVKNAASFSQLDKADIAMLWSKFNIEVKDDGKGGIDMLYHSADGTKQKITKDDLKTLSNDLNNIVTNDTLFNYARAAGQLIAAYDKAPARKAEGVNEPKKDTNAPNLQKAEPVKKEEKKQSASIDEEVAQKRAVQAEKAFLSNSVDKRREESEYHEKQIGQIYENRRELNRYLEKKRAEEQSYLNSINGNN